MSAWRDEFHCTLGANILKGFILPHGATTEEALASLLTYIDGAAGALADHAMLANIKGEELNPFSVAGAASLLQMAIRAARELGEVTLHATPAGEGKV
jgi:hypothetical protein